MYSAGQQETGYERLPYLVKHFHERVVPEREEVDFSSLRPSVYDAKTRTKITAEDASEPKLVSLQKYQLSPEIASSILQSKQDADPQNGELLEASRLAGLRIMARSADSYQTAEKMTNLGKKQSLRRPGTIATYALEKRPKKTQKSSLYF